MQARCDDVGVTKLKAVERLTHRSILQKESKIIYWLLAQNVAVWPSGLRR